MRADARATRAAVRVSWKPVSGWRVDVLADLDQFRLIGLHCGEQIILWQWKLPLDSKQGKTGDGLNSTSEEQLGSFDGREAAARRRGPMEPSRRSPDGRVAPRPAARLGARRQWITPPLPSSGRSSSSLSVILVAGKPLISACLRMIASSFARYTQKVLLSATNDSTHWMSGPSCASTEFDSLPLRAIARAQTSRRRGCPAR